VRRRAFFFLFCLLVFSERVFAEDALLDVENQQRSTKRPTVNETRRIEEKWASMDILAAEGVYTLHTQDQRDSAYYRQALSHFELALATHTELKAKQKEYKDRLAFLDLTTPVLWMKADVLDAAARAQRSLEQRFQLKLNRHYHDIFQSLAEIHRQENQERAAELKAIAERHFSVGLLLTGNYAAAADLLAKYSRRPGVLTEWPLHYYWHLALYGMFSAARRNRGIKDEELRALRRSKNEKLREAVRLKFGEESIQMQHTLQMIRLEELGSPRS